MSDDSVLQGRVDDVTSLISQLYDAAVDPDLWPSALASTGAFLDVAQTVVAAENAVVPTESFFYASFKDMHWLERYAKVYMLINPTRLAMVGRSRTGDTILTTDFMTPAEYSATRFAQELLKERDIVDIAVSILEMTATKITVLSAQRGKAQGFGDETLRAKLQIMLPHVQRAVRICGLLEHHKLASSSLANTLDLLTTAVLLVTGTGGIVHANTQAVQLLDDADIALSSRGRLKLLDSVAARALGEALEGAAHGDVTPATNGRSIAAQARSGKKFVVTIMPLTSGRRRSIGSHCEAVAAICFKEADFEAPTGLRALESLYALTPREMTILAASIELSGVAEISAVMGVTEWTVRSHLKSIFRKTGASRQADLVKLAAGVAGPFKV